MAEVNASQVVAWAEAVEADRDNLRSRCNELSGENNRLGRELGSVRADAERLPSEIARADEAEAALARAEKQIQGLERRLKNSEQRNTALEARIRREAEALRSAVLAEAASRS